MKEKSKIFKLESSKGPMYQVCYNADKSLKSFVSVPFGLYFTETAANQVKAVIDENYYTMDLMHT